MAEELLQYAFYDEEIDLSGELIPCEFCSDLFPFSIIIEHQSGCTLNPLNPNPEASSEADSNKENVVKVSPVKDNVVIASPIKENVVIKIEQLVTNELYHFESGSKASVLKKVTDSDKTSEISKQYITYGDQDDSETDEEDSVASDQCPEPITEIELSDDDNEENETIECYLFKAHIELNKLKRCLTGARPKYGNLHSKNFDEQEKTICSPRPNLNYCF